MLEQIRSKSGHLVLKYDDRFLASRLDPVREAQVWVNRHTGRLERLGLAIFLGSGCGYHLALIQEHLPGLRVLVVEPNERLITFCVSHHGLNESQVHFICSENLEEIKKQISRWRVFEKVYGVFPITSSYFMYPELFSDLQDMLRGRSMESFDYQLSERPDLMDELKTFRLFLSLEGERPGGDLVSIKTLDKTLSRTQSHSRPYRLIKALRELVK